MKRTLTILLTYLSLTTFAQPEDHLEPTDSYLNMDDYRREYYSFVYKHLVKDLQDRPVARMLTLPSRHPESVVSVERVAGSSKFNPQFKLVYKVCKESIWFSEERDKVELIKYENSIDTATVFLIEELFEKMIFKTRYYDALDLPFEGATYIFCSGTRSGEVSTPRAETKVNELAELGRLMIELAKSDKEDDRFKLSSEIRNRAKGLIERLAEG
jgi:hypothetical protein